jgi:low density lipoprotein-related protein 2
VSGVVVDIAAKRVYWTDPKVDRVESIDYSGNDRRQIASGRWVTRKLEYKLVLFYANAYYSLFRNFAPHPFGLAIFDQHLYWTDWTRLGIMRVEKFGANSEVIW